MIRKFEFVFLKPYECAADIGLVVNFDKERGEAKVATLDIGPDFEPKEVKLDDLMTLPKIVIQSVLGDVSCNQGHYAYFIILLNSIDECNHYWIKESYKIQEAKNQLKESNSYIPSSTTTDIKYLLMKLNDYMKGNGIDSWQDEKFTGIANKYAITKENLSEGFY